MTHEEQLREALREVRYWFAANAMPVRAAREAILARIDAALSGKREGEGAAPQIEAGAEARGAMKALRDIAKIPTRILEDAAQGRQSVDWLFIANWMQQRAREAVRLLNKTQTTDAPAAPEARDGKRCRVDLNDTGIGEPVECSEPMPCVDHEAVDE